MNRYMTTIGKAHYWDYSGAEPKLIQPEEPTLPPENKRYPHKYWELAATCMGNVNGSIFIYYTWKEC